MNDVKLQESHPIDEYLRPLKIGGEVSSLELSTDNARLNGLELQGDLIGGKYKLYNDGSYTYLKTDSYFNLETANNINIKAGGIGTDIYSSGTYKTASFLKNPADTSIFYVYPASESLMMDSFAIEVYADAVTKIKTHREDPFGGSEETDAHLTLDIDGDIILDPHSGITKFYLAGDTDDLCTLTVAANGVTTLATTSSSPAAPHLTLDSGGILKLDGHAGIQLIQAGTAFGKFAIDTTSQFILYEQGGASTDDHLTITCATNGATTIRTTDAAAANAHLTIVADGHCEFDGCGVGFDLVAQTQTGVNVTVDFKTGNKQFVTFDTGNITNLKLYFPATSGNFVVLLKQDGSGSRLVTNYNAYDSADNAANGSATVKFAGGSNPTLTTDANHVDIISLFWDADNEIAYGVPSLDFQF